MVVYHHADRSATVEEQARRRLDDIARDVLTAKPVAAVRASRDTTRLFLVAATESQAGYLTDRLAALAASPWGEELKVYWA